MATRDSLDASYAASAGRARRLIERRLADARAHARIGGQADALARLDELAAGLRAHLADSRTGFYRAAAGGPGHPRAEHVAREAKILGRDQHADLFDVIKEAKAGLRSLMVFGGDADQLRHWEGTHAAAITRQIEGSLSNSQMALTSALQAILEQ